MDLQTWQSALLDQLDSCGPEGQDTARFIRERRIRVGIRKASPSVGAIWSMGGNVYLNKRRYSTETPIDDPRGLCLIVHEVHHLRQGIPTALSVYGELEAWQLDFGLYGRLTGIRPGPPLSDLLALPLSYDRQILREARALMQAFGGKGYRADLLPLYPWGKEIAWWVARRVPQ